MRFYYQYTKDGLLSVRVHARVKCSGIPSDISQIVTDTALPEGIKKFDPVAKKVIFFKYTYDGEGEVTGMEEDVSIDRVTIPDADIFIKEA